MISWQQATSNLNILSTDFVWRFNQDTRNHPSQEQASNHGIIRLSGSFSMWTLQQHDERDCKLQTAIRRIFKQNLPLLHLMPMTRCQAKRTYIVTQEVRSPATTSQIRNQSDKITTKVDVFIASKRHKDFIAFERHEDLSKNPGQGNQSKSLNATTE